MASPPKQVNFLLIVYGMPAKPTAGRVAVWRQLKKIGAIYLHQSVCVFIDNAKIRRELQPIQARIREAGGEYHLLPLRRPQPDEYDKLVAQFVEQTSRHYLEIVENCEVNFVKEIEFETFRKNFTYEEAEEIRVEFDKISKWLDQVKQRDWFSAPHREEAESWVKRAEHLLEQFEAKVYEVQERSQAGAAVQRARGRRGRRARPVTIARGESRQQTA